MYYDQPGNQGFGGPEGSDQAPPAGPGGWGPSPGYGFPASPPAGAGNYPPGQSGGGHQAPPYGPPPGPPGPGYGGYPGGYYPPPARRTDGTAIAALVLAIVSFVICPVIPAIVALVLIPNARRQINSSGGMLEGSGLLTAAKIVSWINIGLWTVLGAIYAVVLIGLVASSSSSNNGAILRFLLGA